MLRIDAAPVGLGPIQGRIRVGEQGPAILCVVGEDRDADAGRDQGTGGRGFILDAQGLNDLLGEVAGPRRVVKVGDDDGKLVAAQASHHLAGVEKRGYAFREPF